MTWVFVVGPKTKTYGDSRDTEIPVVNLEVEVKEVNILLLLLVLVVRNFTTVHIRRHTHRGVRLNRLSDEGFFRRIL